MTKPPPKTSWICFDCAGTLGYFAPFDAAYTELGQCTWCGASILIVIDIDDLRHVGHDNHKKKPKP